MFLARERLSRPIHEIKKKGFEDGSRLSLAMVSGQMIAKPPNGPHSGPYFTRIT
jgi:hypothetical protein